MERLEMPTLRKVLILASATIAVTGAAIATETVNWIVGTWKLNVAKSTYTPGPPPKGLTRIYTESVQGLTLTWKGVDADGKENTGTKVLRLDGKDYPATAPDYDTSSTTRIDEFTIAITDKRAGKVVGTMKLVVSKDQKTMTLIGKGVDAKGVTFEKLALYDRQ
jgi:hypothetical protein